MTREPVIQPAVHYHAVACWPFPVDPRAAWIGFDGVGQYIGECGPADAAWQAAHAHCNHNIALDAWWVLIGLGKQKPVEVRDHWKARTALLNAGAVRLKELPPDP